MVIIPTRTGIVMKNYNFYKHKLTDTEFKQLSKRDKRLYKRSFALTLDLPPKKDTTAYCYNRKQLGNI
mgnify:CR=1 FL=1